jgi:hypothetical protein
MHPGPQAWGRRHCTATVVAGRWALVVAARWWVCNCWHFFRALGAGQRWSFDSPRKQGAQPFRPATVASLRPWNGTGTLSSFSVMSELTPPPQLEVNFAPVFVNGCPLGVLASEEPLLPVDEGGNHREWSYQSYTDVRGQLQHNGREGEPSGTMELVSWKRQSIVVPPSRRGEEVLRRRDG